MKSKRVKTIISILSISALLLVPIMGTFCLGVQTKSISNPDEYTLKYGYLKSLESSEYVGVSQGGYFGIGGFEPNTEYTLYWTDTIVSDNDLDIPVTAYLYSVGVNFDISDDFSNCAEFSSQNPNVVRYINISAPIDSTLGYNYVTFTTSADSNYSYSGGTISGCGFYTNRVGESTKYYNFYMNSLHLVKGNKVPLGGYSLDGVHDPSFDIPGGTMLVLDFGNNPSVDEIALTTTTTISSPLFGPWQTGAKEMHPSSLNRTFSYNYISEQADMISWSKADHNILGQSKNAFHNSVISGTSARYYVLINPKAVNIENRDEWIDLAPIHVQVFGSIKNAYTFKLNQNWYNIVPDLDSPGSSRILYDNNGELEWRTSSELTASNIENGGVSSDSIGAVATTIPTQSGTTSSSDDTGIIGSISGLLESGSNNVNTLSNNSRGFMSGLATLYSYLPEDLLALILTTLTVVVIVCIFKLFI